jgi:excinuclease UvrABC helicase subunit UvrB
MPYRFLFYQRWLAPYEEMTEAARKFEFEKAAQLRDRVKGLKMGEG